MRILVVDDEPSFGSLLSRALKRLGHAPKVACHPDDALSLFRSHPFDAVITDIDLPGMNGVALARAIRALADEMPIAFCTGSEPSEQVIEEAATIGPVLPKVWTVADVRVVIGKLEAARGEASRRRSEVPDAPTEPIDEHLRPRRLAPRKIKIGCRDWSQVARLCDEHAAGRNSITLRGRHKVVRGEKVVIALSLPDELVLSIPGEVHSIDRDPVDDARVIFIKMVGLTPEVVTRLRSMCHRAGVSARTTYSKRNRQARGSGAEPAVSTGAVLGNVRLRKQIDQLGKKLGN
ncbi:MAG TPA: response regulator [Kofleriaceae bacterium]|nr:response regulator [Kofleriaceae bacterium]